MHRFKPGREAAECIWFNTSSYSMAVFHITARVNKGPGPHAVPATTYLTYACRRDTDTFAEGDGRHRRRCSSVLRQPKVSFIACAKCPRYPSVPGSSRRSEVTGVSGVKMTSHLRFSVVKRYSFPQNDWCPIGLERCSRVRRTICLLSRGPGNCSKVIRKCRLRGQ